MLSRRRVLLGGATIGLAGCGSSDNFTGNPSPLQATSPVTQGTNSQLFVLNANSGTRNGDQLRLVNVNPDVVWFDDRPSRQAGRQTTLSFVQGWASRGFDSDPPNAVLQVDNSSFPIILSQPILDGPAQTLSFTIQSDAGAPPLDQLPTTFGACALFIDDAGSGASMPLSLQFALVPGDTLEVLVKGVEVPVTFSVGIPGYQSGLTLSSTTALAPLTVAVFFDSILVSLPGSVGGANFELDLFLLSQPGIQNFQLASQGSAKGSLVNVTYPSSAVLTTAFTNFAWVNS